MRVVFKMYRTANVQTEQLKGNLGLPLEASSEAAAEEMRKQFGPFAYNLKIFWPAPDGYKKTVVGMEAMAFELGDPRIPVSGLVTCDLFDEKSINRIDGALEGELRRLNLSWANPDTYEWRGWYEIKE